ncbi:hypothetical protein CRE_06128 [Caenorhabditis remanei]|uniref:F-box domain-containing protein n=1 Tax=Caenorhabditis remanei TaxID=31234 RepID=E3NEB4_CAERE|nr:hypothetical protein CRE_06128 [Caenorhabditis remanei]
MEPSFPLLRLPENVIIEVIKNFPLSQLFKFSLISSKTKNLVSSLGLEASDVDINIWNTIKVAVRIGINSLDLYFYKDSNDPNALMPVDVNIPVAPTCDYEDTRIQSTTPFNFSNWLNHINSVFCLIKPPDVYITQGCARFEIELLRNAIGNANYLIVCADVSNTCGKKILKSFNTHNRLILDRNPFEDTCQIQQIFINNFEMIIFYDVYSLDDMLSLLIIFSRSVRLSKQFNQFLKHWIRGFNPRLEDMSLSINKTDFVKGKVYLNGIKCIEMSEKTKRKMSENFFRPYFDDIIQIRRKDGTAAVIGTHKFEDILDIRFVVLH